MMQEYYFKKCNWYNLLTTTSFLFYPVSQDEPSTVSCGTSFRAVSFSCPGLLKALDWLPFLSGLQTVTVSPVSSQMTPTTLL